MSDGVMQEARQIVFSEGELLVKEIESEKELRQAYHLRQRVLRKSYRGCRRGRISPRPMSILYTAVESAKRDTCLWVTLPLANPSILQK